MDLTIRTLQGNCNFQSVLPGLTVEEFKKQLYDAATSKNLLGLNIPEPERQNLVFRGNALVCGSLEEAGVQSGDSVVILSVPPPPSPIQYHTTGPSEETIAAAIRAHAIKHGKESHLMAPERARPRPRPLATTDGAVLGSDQLEIIVDALQESLGRRLPVNNTENEEEEAAPEEEQEEEELQIPEPSADHMQIITESTGFDAAVVRKSLILHRNDLNVAVNWLYEHQHDADFAEPIPEATLHSLYGRPRYHRRYLPARPDLVAQLVEMGFEEEQSREALVRMRNSMELAILLLLRRSRATQEQDAHLAAEEETGEASEGQPNPENPNPVAEQPIRHAPDASPEEAEAEEHTPGNSVPPVSVDWSHVEFEEAEDMPEEPPASEVNVDLVDENDMLADSSDFDQGDMDGVSLRDFVRLLGGEEADSEGRRSYMQRLVEGSDDVQLPFSISELVDYGDAEPEGDSSAVYDTLAEMLNVVRDSSQSMDPYGAGPSGEVHEDLDDYE